MVTSHVSAPRKRALAVLASVLFVPSGLWAQCAMCRTALLASPEGQAMAAGVNQGILFLLAAPFLIVVAVGTLIVVSRYRKLRAVPVRKRLPRNEERAAISSFRRAV